MGIGLHIVFNRKYAISLVAILLACFPCVSGAQADAEIAYAEKFTTYLAEKFTAQQNNECMLAFEYLSRNPLDNAPADYSVKMGGMAWMFGGAADLLKDNPENLKDLREGKLYNSRKMAGGNIDAISKQDALSVFMGCSDVMLTPEFQDGFTKSTGEN